MKKYAWVLAALPLLLVSLLFTGSAAAATTDGITELKGGPGNGGGGGGGHEETAGNNLSLPVIWSDGVALALRGVFGEPRFEGVAFPEDCLTAGVECWYLQQDADNEWQAGSVDAVASAWPPVTVDLVDWGDNLEAKDWYVTSIVRVETVLYQDVSTAPMVAFTMVHLWGEGPSEMWGTNTIEYPSSEATVYSGCARMTIQLLTKERDDPTLAVVWNPLAGQWEGDVEEPIFNSAVWEGGEGPDSATTYSAEINVPGKVIYGYNWNVRRTSRGPGDYRLTFSLDGLACPVALHTFFDDESQVLVPTEEELLAVALVGAEPTGGGVPVIDVADNLTYIDVRILSRSGGGGKNH